MKSSLAKLAFLAALLALMVTGCSSPIGAPPSPSPTATRSVPPTPTGFTSAPSSIHLAYLRARSYTPDVHLAIPLSGGHMLYAIHSVCTGSADGHCQAVDAFIDNQRDPVFDRQYSAVKSLQKVAQGFVVAARSYKPGDPLCCPSGPTVRDRYIWDGKTLQEHGPLPQEPSG